VTRYDAGARRTFMEMKSTTLMAFVLLLVPSLAPAAQPKGERVTRKCRWLMSTRWN